MNGLAYYVKSSLTQTTELEFHLSLGQIVYCINVNIYIIHVHLFLQK